MVEEEIAIDILRVIKQRSFPYQEFVVYAHCENAAALCVN